MFRTRAAKLAKIAKSRYIANARVNKNATKNLEWGNAVNVHGGEDAWQETFQTRNTKNSRAIEKFQPNWETFQESTYWVKHSDSDSDTDDLDLETRNDYYKNDYCFYNYYSRYSDLDLDLETRNDRYSDLDLDSDSDYEDWYKRF